MEIETIVIEKINLAPYNPRKDLKPGDPEYQALKRSIAHFGYVDPMIWNKRTGNLVGGHQRFKILLEQGDRAVAVSVVDLDEQNEKALNLALNKISGEWDILKLGEILADMPQEVQELTGFQTAEIDNILATGRWDGVGNENLPSFSEREKDGLHRFTLAIIEEKAEEFRDDLVLWLKEKWPTVDVRE